MALAKEKIKAVSQATYNNMTSGEQVLYLRGRKLLTQKQLGKIVTTSSSTISRIEKGQIDDIKMDLAPIIQRLKDFFGVDIKMPVKKAKQVMVSTTVEAAKITEVMELPKATESNVTSEYRLTEEMKAFVKNPNNKIFIEEAMMKAEFMRRMIKEEIVNRLD